MLWAPALGRHNVGSHCVVLPNSKTSWDDRVTEGDLKYADSPLIQSQTHGISIGRGAVPPHPQCPHEQWHSLIHPQGKGPHTLAHQWRTSEWNFPHPGISEAVAHLQVLLLS